MLKNYLDSKWKWHPIIKFRCQPLSLTMNIFALFVFSILFCSVYFPSEVAGLQTSQTMLLIREIEAVVTKFNVKTLCQPFAMFIHIKPLFIPVTHTGSPFSLEGLLSE